MAKAGSLRVHGDQVESNLGDARRQGQITALFQQIANALEQGRDSVVSFGGLDMVQSLHKLRFKMESMRGDYLRSWRSWWHRVSYRDFDTAYQQVVDVIQSLIHSIAEQKLDASEEWTRSERNHFLEDDYEAWLAERERLRHELMDGSVSFVGVHRMLQAMDGVKDAQALVQQVVDWLEWSSQRKYDIKKLLKLARHEKAVSTSMPTHEAIERLSQWHARLRLEEERMQDALRRWRNERRSDMVNLEQALARAEEALNPKQRQRFYALSEQIRRRELMDRRFLAEVTRFATTLLQREELLLLQLEQSLPTDQVLQDLAEV